MTHTERDEHGNTPMDYDADSETDEVYGRSRSSASGLDPEAVHADSIL
ncbi:hypothetical protein VB779_07290 [Haloarculaceae archaeon H-GB11]|nr:hypothetical protein [Haloarculaceae archaeon H-GB11]